MKHLLKFFKRRLLLTHVYGIPILLDYRWFVFLLLMAWLTTSSIPEELVEDTSFRVLLGTITVIIFFSSIVLHELAHAFIARREGIQVLEILLHPFGGLARLGREPDNPGAEFRIAIAGPLASFIISFFFIGLFAISRSIETDILSALFFLLFLLNFLLAVFNLFPGYPLDGGRVLRAILWKRGSDLNEATILTGKFGQIIAVTLIVVGSIILVINRDFFMGLWTILIGIFLYDAAAGIIRQINNFENLIVENVMELAISVKPSDTIMEFVDNILPLYRKSIFPVAEKKQLYGFMLLEDIKENFERELWRTTLVRDAMRPIREDYFVEASSSILEARNLMQLNGIKTLGVIDKNAQLVGVLQDSKIKRNR